MKNFLPFIAISFTIIMFYFSCITYNDTHHNTFSRNYITGVVELDTIPGIRLSVPWVQVVRIDNRPLLE